MLGRSTVYGLVDRLLEGAPVLSKISVFRFFSLPNSSIHCSIVKVLTLGT